MFKQGINNLFRISTALMLFSSMSTQAISLSTYRIYLDNDNSTASFIMFNKEDQSQTCELDVGHRGFDEMGNMLRIDDSVTPFNSAAPWFRYSPRNFIAGPHLTQTVRFTLRRKANSNAAEYRSYLKVYCDTDAAPVASESDLDQPKVGVKPRIVQNVPIIVRTGKLDAQISFSSMLLQNKQLSFIIHRKGNRSVYGTLQLVNKKNDEVIDYTRNVSLYTETNQLAQQLSTSGIPANQLALRFVEDEKYGGTITFQQEVKLN